MTARFNPARAVRGDETTFPSQLGAVGSAGVPVHLTCCAVPQINNKLHWHRNPAPDAAAPREPTGHQAVIEGWGGLTKEK